MSQKSEHTEPRVRRFDFRVFRYDAEGGAAPRFDRFELDVTPGTTVLSALFLIQQTQDSSLAFRFSCRGAVCGSCAMTINGYCGLACRTQLWQLPTNEVILEPLPNLDVIRDLVVDMTPFWDKYRRIRPWLHAGDGGSGKSTAEPAACECLQSPQEAGRIEQYANCILCGCCYGACPVLKRQPEYLGPAALAKLARFVNDSRDARPAAALTEVDHADGVWGCDTVFRCIDACPKDVRPTDGIASLRRRLALYRVRRLGRRSAQEPSDASHET